VILFVLDFSGESDMKPLSGMKVLDMTHVLAGPYCTYQLGMLGAEIVKVETPRGDMVRGWGGSEAQLDEGLGSGFVAQNAGKKSIVVDMKVEEGAALLRRLAVEFDIIVQNYRPGTMARYGLDFDTVVAGNPGVVYASISAMGAHGPLSHRPGFDDVVQATSGFMSINVRGDGPIRTGGPVLDYATGMHATSAILAAVMMQRATGEAQHVDIAMQDVTLLLMNRNTHISATTGKAPLPAGNREAPMLGRFAAKEGYVMLAGYLPHHCRSLCRAIGLDEEAQWSAKQFAQRGAELEQRVEAQLLKRTAAEWDQIFAAAGVVGGGVAMLDDVAASEHIAERGLFSTRDSAAGAQRVTNAGYRINGEMYGPGPGVPRLGQDTAAVLKDVGFDDTEIEQLVATGAIGPPRGV